MFVPVQVRTYSGFRADERPQRFSFGGQTYQVAVVLEHWRSPEGEYFRVRSTVGGVYLLHHDERDAWRLETGDAEA